MSVSAASILDLGLVHSRSTKDAEGLPGFSRFYTDKLIADILPTSRAEAKRLREAGAVEIDRVKITTVYVDLLRAKAPRYIKINA